MPGRKRTGSHMATWEEADDALVDAIATLTAKAAEHAKAPTVALKLAAAVNQLAEARAWLNAPAQPHGGSVTTD